MIPDWLLERYAVGELSPEDRARVEGALASDPVVRERLAAQTADTAQTLTSLPPARVATEVRRRLQPRAVRPVNRFKVLVPAFTLALASLSLVVFVQQRPEEIRLKGDGPSLRLFRMTKAGPERLQPPVEVRPHELVQVSFDTAGQASAVIFSIDGSGQVTLHTPKEGEPPLEKGQRVLPQAFELDEAPGFERFFLVTSDGPLSKAEVLRAASALARSPDARTAPLQAPASATVRSVLLDKVAP